MSTKQLRLTGPDQIQESIKRLIGKKINIVLTDNMVVFGELKEANALGLLVQNMRLKKVRCAFAKISEIYFDTSV
jgi:hypothetical protein